MTDPRDIPSIPDNVAPDLRRPLVRMREALQTLLGFRGDGSGAALTVASGGGGTTVIVQPGGTPGGGGGTPEEPDLTPPPQPDFVTVQAGVTEVIVSFGGITYTQGHGHKQANIYAVKRDPASAAAPPVFGDAPLVSVAPNAITVWAIPSEPNLKWFVWVKFESNDGVESVTPAGGTNGAQGTTGQDVAGLLSILSGQIRETQLFASLNTRINLVDGPDTLAGSVAARILAEATARGTAISAEATTRANADSALASSIVTINASVGSNAAAIVAEQTARVNADNALAGSINAIAASISNGVGSGFEALLTWDFNGSDNGWTSSGASTSVQAEFIRVTSTGIDPIFRSPSGLSIVGGRYDKVRARVRRIAGTGFDGRLFYINAGHAESSSYYKQIPDTTVLNQWVVLEWDMAALTDGGADWTSSTITSLRLDLGNSAADVFEVDWVSVGRRGNGVTQAAFVAEQTARADGDGALAANITSLTATVSTNNSTLTAAINNEATARANADSALASNVSTLFSQVGANSAAISTEATTRASLDGAVQALYTLRAQVTSGGRTLVGGFGLSATATASGGPTIDFGVLANRFYVGAPAGSGVSDILPFVIQTTSFSDNGVVRPAGVYINAAYILNLTAIYATISSLVADSIAAANISVAQLLAGTLRVGGFIQSTNYVASVSGWRISADGTAELSGVVVRGTIYVGAGTLSGIIIGGSDLRSFNYVPGSTGFRINADGSAEFYNITVRGTVYATAGLFQGEVSVGGATYTTGTGFWTGIDGGVAKMRVGSTTSYMRWTGTALEIVNVVITQANFTASVGAVSTSVLSNAGARPAGTGTVSVSGGTAPFSYSWQILDLQFAPSGGSFADVDPNNENFFILGSTTGTGVTYRAYSAGQGTMTGKVRCTVVDSAGRTAIAINTINVNFT